MVDPEDRLCASQLLDRILELREKANAHAQSLHYLNNELLTLEARLQALQPGRED